MKIYDLPLLLFALVLCVGACRAQNPETGTSTSPPLTSTAPSASAPRPQYFAGTLMAITDDQITVSRTLVGHQPDTRIFQITPKTKLNRANCKLNAKVTVRYQRLPDGNVALQVVVHPDSKAGSKHS